MFHNQKIIYACCILILLFISKNANAASSCFKKEIDSIQSIVNQNLTDTGKFYFLYNYTHNNISPVIDFDRYAFFGRWAYTEIKNSSDKKALSYGYDLLGSIFLQEGMLDSSKIFLTKSFEIRKQLELQYELAWSNYNLGKLNIELGNIKEAIYQLEQAKSVFQKIKYYYGETSTYYLLSVIYNRLGNYDSTFVYKQLVIEMSKNHFDDSKVIQAYLDITNTYKQANDIKNCYAYFNKALALAENIKDERQLAFVYTAIGNFFFEQKKNNTLALEYYFHAMRISKKISAKYRIALLESQIGKVYLAEGKDSLALQYHLRNLERIKELNYGYGISIAYENLGNTYKKMGNYSLALSSYHKCLGITNFQESKIYFHEVLMELADLYIIMNNPGDALDNYLKALKLSETYHDQSKISKTELIIGNFYQKKGLLQLAEKHYKRSLESARTARNIETIKKSADNLSHLFLQKDNYTLAYNYLNIAKEATDSLSKINSQISLAELELRFEFEKINQKNEMEQKIAIAEIKKQKAYRNSFLVISVLLGLLGAFVFMSYKRKKKDNLKLVAQKKEIQRISKELHETDQMKLRFFSNISHEIRTPLTLILNPLKNLIKSFNGNQEEKRQLELILNNTNRLHELTNQILDLQKLDNGNLKLEFTNGDIVLYVKGIISSFEGYCNKTNCKLTFTSRYSSMICKFDRDKITKILSNILTNAFKYSNIGGKINVDLKIDNKLLIISVKDTGKGIHKEHQANVFKRYYQVETSDKQYEGTGIGLAYVKELVELFHGNVDINSEPGKGTAIIVSIPITKYKIINSDPIKIEIKPFKKSPVKSHVLESLNIAHSNENSLSILIVEDNNDLRDFIGSIFKENYTIIQAKNGNEGIQKTFHFFPDIIISDIMMPDMEGLEMCSTLKQDPLTCHIPIILLTAKDNSESHMKGYESGAEDYIIKPFNPEILKLKVRNILTAQAAIKKQFNGQGKFSDFSKYTDKDQLFLKKCMNIIMDHIDDRRFTVDIFAEQLAFSRRNLYRKLRALTDLNPAELIRYIRIQHAANLLKTTDMRIQEVAMAIGYENTNNFSNAFKKYYGVLPSQYTDIKS